MVVSPGLTLPVAVEFHLLLGDVGALLGVLLVLGVEVVDGVGHDVLGVHRLLQVGRYALQRHGAPVGHRLLLGVQVVREGEAQGNGGEEHLDTDDEVLVAGGHCARCAGLLAHSTDDTRLLQDSQEHAWGRNKY